MPKAVTRPTRYGPQPGRELLEKQRWTYAAACRAKNIERHYTNLKYSMLGTVRPRPEVVQALCELLSCEPTDLYTEEILSEPFMTGVGRGKAVAK